MCKSAKGRWLETDAVPLLPVSFENVSPSPSTSFVVVQREREREIKRKTYGPSSVGGCVSRFFLPRASPSPATAHQLFAFARACTRAISRRVVNPLSRAMRLRLAENFPAVTTFHFFGPLSYLVLSLSRKNYRLPL